MRTQLLVLALAVLAPVTAASAADRLSYPAFLKLNRCAAYGGADGQAVASDVGRQAVGRQELVTTRAHNEAGQIARKVRMAKTGAALAAMDAERSEACAAAVTADPSDAQAAMTQSAKNS